MLIALTIIMLFAFGSQSEEEPQCYLQSTFACLRFKCIKIDRQPIETNYLNELLENATSRITAQTLIEGQCRSIQLENANITNLRDLNLNSQSLYQEIHFSGIQLKDIDEEVFDGFTNLTRLFLDHNELEFIKFHKGLPMLEELYLYNNLIEEFTSQNLPQADKLKILYLSFNNIETLTGLTCNFVNLEEFNIQNNNIKELGECLRENYKLRYLNLASNQLENIGSDDFGSLAELAILLLNDNLLTNIDNGSFVNLKSLHILHLQNNRLNHVKAGMFTGLDNLKFLYLSRNNIDKIDSGAFIPLNNLSCLYLTENCISILKKGTFQGLDALYLLDLGNGKIREIEEEAFVGLDNLDTLILSYNEIFRIEPMAFKGLSHLSIMTLDNNSFNIVPNTFYGLSSLHYISLKYNDNIIPLGPNFFFGLISIKYLDLSNFNLTTIPSGTFNGLDKLEGLQLNENSIEYIEEEVFVGIPKLKELDLSSSNIKKIAPNAFYELSSVTTFNIRQNNLPHLYENSFRGLKKVKVLDLSFQTLEKIDARVFNGLISLQSLYLNNNKLNGFPLNCFEGLKSLVTLDLKSNNIHKLQSNVFAGLTQLENLNLSQNGLQELEGHTFFTLGNLVNLNLIENSIGILRNNSLNGLGRLRTLSVINAGIKLIECGAFRGVSALHFLDLSKNHISHFEHGTFLGLHNLAKLTLNGNITEIGGKTFQQLPNLSILSIVHANLAEIKTDTFNGLSNLGYLFISLSTIESISYGAFRGLGKSTIIMFIRNSINTIRKEAFIGLSHLAILQVLSETCSFHNEILYREHYNLCNMGIKNIEPGAFRDLHLKSEPNSFHSVLNLAHNKLIIIENNSFVGLDQLSRLDLERNRITSLEANAFSSLTALKYLSLASNKINYFEKYLFKDLKSLGTIDVSNNKITSLSSRLFMMSKSLNTFKASQNLIAELPENAFAGTTIESINFGENKISKIADNAFGHLNLLRYLNLSHNDITEFNVSKLSDVTGLLSLDLQSNYIENIDSDLLIKSFPLLIAINIDDNKFSCDILPRIILNLKKADIYSNKTGQHPGETYEGISCIPKKIGKEVFECNHAHKSVDLTNFKAAVKETNRKVNKLFKHFTEKPAFFSYLNDVMSRIEDFTDSVHQTLDNYNKTKEIQKSVNLRMKTVVSPNESKKMDVFEVLLIIICVIFCLGQVLRVYYNCKCKDKFIYSQA